MTATTTQTRQIADRLVELCQKGENVSAITELYSDDVVSVEAMDGGPDHPAQISGKEAVLGKTNWWLENHEVHSGNTEGPFMHGEDQFGLIFDMDVTNKPSGNRFQMRELAIFTVKGDKITREEFYYTMDC